MKLKATVLLSGGIDSAACARFLQDNEYTVSCVFVDYGHAAAHVERGSAESLAALLRTPLSVVTVRASRNFGSGEISGRNAFLVLAALTFCEVTPGVIALGIHAGTPYYDCGPAFLMSINRVVAEYTDGRTRVVAPFISWTKRQTLDYYVGAGFPTNLSYSCEAGTLPPCGSCASCLDRRILGCPT